MAIINRHAREEMISFLCNKNIQAKVEDGTVTAILPVDKLKVISVGEITTIHVHDNNGNVIIKIDKQLNAAQQWLLRWFGIEFCLKHNVISLDD